MAEPDRATASVVVGTVPLGPSADHPPAEVKWKTPPLVPAWSVESAPTTRELAKEFPRTASFRAFHVTPASVDWKTPPPPSLWGVPT